MYKRTTMVIFLLLTFYIKIKKVNYFTPLFCNTSNRDTNLLLITI